MNFTKSRPTTSQRALALALSAGFLSFLPGCSLRDSSVNPVPPPPQQAQSHEIPVEEMLAAAFGSGNPALAPLVPDQAHDSIS